MSFIEVTINGDWRKVLVNSEYITRVVDGASAAKTVEIHVLEHGDHVQLNVKESFDEVKKRLGLAITPRAETLALR